MNTRHTHPDGVEVELATTERSDIDGPTPCCDVPHYYADVLQGGVLVDVVLVCGQFDGCGQPFWGLH
jgi:hypothetical protein